MLVAQGGLALQFFYLHLLHIWNSRHVSPCPVNLEFLMVMINKQFATQLKLIWAYYSKWLLQLGISTLCILTGFHDKACRDFYMSGHHHHRQARNSLSKYNPSWAIFGTVCISQNPEWAKHKTDLYNSIQRHGFGRTSWFSQSHLNKWLGAVLWYMLFKLTHLFHKISF
jgi:hypothetical protein